jgi:flagellar export protein FliJ
MKKFEFQLEKVRRWTDTRRQVGESRLETLLSQLHRIDEEFTRDTLQCDDFGRQVYRRQHIDSASLAELGEFREFMGREKIRVERLRSEINRQIETQRSLITEIKRRIALLDKLKESHLRGWQKEADRELQQLADELIAYRFTREL